MPVKFYTENEFNELVRERNGLQTRIEVLEAMRPAWGLDAHSTVAALTDLWKMLGAKNQTEAVQAINDMKEASKS